MTVLDYFNKRIPIFCARKIDINNNINIRIIRTQNIESFQITNSFKQ